MALGDPTDTLISLCVQGSRSIAYVEVQGAGTLGPVTRGGPSDTVAKAAHSFEDAISVVEPVAGALVTRLANLEHGTEAVELKFGLKFRGEASWGSDHVSEHRSEH
jgi:hypothetical protein